jgi:hypothetical protein
LALIMFVVLTAGVIGLIREGIDTLVAWLG